MDTDDKIQIYEVEESLDGNSNNENTNNNNNQHNHSNNVKNRNDNGDDDEESYDSPNAIRHLQKTCLQPCLTNGPGMCYPNWYFYSWNQSTEMPLQVLLYLNFLKSWWEIGC